MHRFLPRVPLLVGSAAILLALASAAVFPAGAAVSAPAVTAQGVAAPTVLADGDSITVGGYVAMYSASHGGVIVRNFAVGGSTLANMESRAPEIVGVKPAVFTVLAGTNGFPMVWKAGRPSFDGAAWHEQYMAYVGRIRAAGPKVLVGTLLPQCNPTNDGGLAAFNSKVPAENERIRAEVGKRIDGVFDIATLVTGDPQQWACDRANLKDGTHPTPAVQSAMSVIYEKAVDAALAQVHVSPASSAGPSGLEGGQTPFSAQAAHPRIFR